MLKYHIQTVELASSQATISFNSIPQDFTDILILFSGRTTGNVSSEQWVFGNLGINGDGLGVNQSGIMLQGRASPESYSAAPRFFMTSSAGTSNTFGNNAIYISNYTSANQKSIYVDGSSEDNSTSGAITILSAGLWSRTSAINSVTLYPRSGAGDFATGTIASLYGVRRGSDGIVNAQPAYGGEITTSGGYTIHTFNTSGTFTTTRPLSCEYLVIGGGGGGGGGAANNNGTGGGGAGGYRESSITTSSLASYIVSVGAGGAGGAGDPINQTTSLQRGLTGSSSSVFGFTMTGGGGGGAGNTGGNSLSNGLSGGSGGGGGAYAGTAGAGTSGQGFAGGAGPTVSEATSVNIYRGGGGGGASSAGSTGLSSGNGGNGISSAINGTLTARAGGGGGGAQSTISGGLATAGGGKGGGTVSTIGAPGTSNTGGGGGGGAWQPSGNNGGTGGSGVVIIRYLTP